MLGHDAISLSGTIRGQQQDGAGVRSLHAEEQVEECEWIRIPPLREGDDVEDDPQRDDGEYAAINSAIDELIPARVCGRVDLIINGSFWLGSILGSVAAIVLLNEALLPANVGWRVAFGIGAILGLSILVVRRHVPESPRWLFIHGREDEAERIVEGIEERIVEQTGDELPAAERSIKVRQSHWGPGRFTNALHEATAEGRIHRLSRTTFGPRDRG